MGPRLPIKEDEEKAHEKLERWLNDPERIRPIDDPKEFFQQLVLILVTNILVDMEQIHESKVVKLANALYATAQWIASIEKQLVFQRQNAKVLRAWRVKFGRARKHVHHSLNSLLEAEHILQDQSQLKRGWLKFKFSGPLRDLKRLGKDLAKWEFTVAALLHPGLRKTTAVEDLAAKTPYKLHHPDLGITQGSADLEYLAVERVDGLIRKFNAGSSHHVNQFISDFLKMSLDWNVTPGNVKTKRSRIKNKKLPQPSTRTASSTPNSIK